MSEDWKSLMNRARSRPSEEREGMDKGSLGIIESVSTETEKNILSDFGGGAPANVTHPFVSIRSWIRVMPEEGTAAVLNRRGDSAVSEVSYYWSGRPEQRTSKYRRGVGYYRPLERGEFEMSSYGLAQVYASRHGSLDLRGGITRGWLSNEELEVGFRAPTHRRSLHDNIIEDTDGEERFGVVWRRSPSGERSYYKVDGSFAKEYIRSLTFQGIPRVLVEHKEGHVHESDGTRARAPSGEFVRSRTRYNDSEGEPTETMVDESGNSWEVLSDNARTGKVVRSPRGSFKVEVGENIRLNAVKDIQGTARNMVVRVRDVLHLEGDIAVKLVSTGMIALQAPVIEFNGRAVQEATAPI